MSTLRQLVLFGLLVSFVTMLGIPAHATYGARVTSDEPQYLLSALSLGEDLDLDISDEIARAAYRPFHRVNLDQQTQPTESGHQFSPHDPALSVLLAVPMRLGGWAAAKATIALCAGALAALTAWVAIRRFGVAPRWAMATTGVFALTTPLGVYATQVYPEVPAALTVMAVVAVLTGTDTRRSAIAAVVGPTVLLWLSVKYAPVAGTLAALALWRVRRTPRVVMATVAALAVQGVIYLAVHRVIYGGWTVYAAGDHFVDTGEFSVVGVDPNYVGRSRRLIGLLVDREFGLIAWAPAWLLLAPALGAFARRRPPGSLTLVLPALAGWFVATWVALTMHGWWWPGRQVVVIAPLLGVVIAWWLPQVRLGDGRGGAVMLAVGGVLGIASWGWTMWEAATKRRVLVVDFMQTANPWYRLWRHALPFGRLPDAADDWLTALWVVLVVLAAYAGWWGIGRSDRERSRAQRRAVTSPV